MMTVHARPGQTLSHLMRRLIELAGGDRSAVRSSHGGALVDDSLALAYLTSGAVTWPPGPKLAAPPAVVQMVHRVEVAGGLTKPRDDGDQPAAAAEEPHSTTTTARPPRAPRKALPPRPARNKESVHV